MFDVGLLRDISLDGLMRPFDGVDVQEILALPLQRVLTLATDIKTYGQRLPLARVIVVVDRPLRTLDDAHQEEQDHGADGRHDQGAD